MLRVISEMIASFFVSSGAAKEEDKDIYVYGIENLLYNIGTILLMLFISIYFNNVIETMVFLIAFKLLRNYSGGYHASSRIKCFITSMIVYLADVYIVHYINTRQDIVTLITLSAVSVGFMFLLAPIDTIKRKITQQEREHCKKINRILLLSISSIIPILFQMGCTSLGVYISLALITATLSLIVEVIKRQGRLWYERKNNKRNGKFGF